MNDEASPLDTFKELKGLLGDEWKKTLGKRTTQLILATLVIGGVELTYGLPIVTLATSPLVAGVIVFLWDSVATWLRSNKPQVIFYACPVEGTFTPILWGDLPRHRKRRACQCGAPLIKKCPSGKHFIVSPDPAAASKTNPEPPMHEGVCPYCDPSLPIENRRYLPTDGHNWKPPKNPWWKFWNR
jgi:hypothetical protein